MLPTRAEKKLASNIRFLAGDVMTAPLSLEGFDFVAAIAVLHHLPLQEGLARLGSLLSPGGTLAVVGLYRPSTMSDYAWAALAAPVSCVLRRLLPYVEVQACKTPPKETLADIRRATQELLPGAVVRRRFFFRYSLVWQKPL